MSDLYLKLSEPEIKQETIWDDDKLGGRKDAADALTNLIIGQQYSLVLSLNGSWGCGKTFFLKRWEADLEKSGFQAIYFNAWESDYCGDPLVAIIGQLWDYLKKSDYKEVANSLKENAQPLLEKFTFTAVKYFTAGAVDIDRNELKSFAKKAVDNYFEQGKAKIELKKRLIQLVSPIYEKDKKPLIFIIDELDRCRPTFAIELLERVKHIFDIPGMVFVFGVDREQLGNAIKAVYGDIDVDGYLRRFFDMDFLLPQNNTSVFCESLLVKYGVTEYLQEKGKTINKIHAEDFMNFQNLLSNLTTGLMFSLRDIEHAARMFICAVKNIQDNYSLYPEILIVLIVLKLKNIEMYKECASGKSRACEILDYISNNLKMAEPEFRSSKQINLNYLEASFYATEQCNHSSNDIVLQQLSLLEQGKALTAPEYLSSRTKRLLKSDLQSLINIYQSKKSGIYGGEVSRSTLNYLIKKIELSSLLLGEGIR